jgi:hypothetical protein
MANFVEFSISNLGTRAASTCEAIPGSVVDGSDVVIRSPPNCGNSINELVIWVWGRLIHKRRIPKSLQVDGATLVCTCKAPRGQVVLSPNATVFLHLTGTKLVVGSEA